MHDQPKRIGVIFMPSLIYLLSWHEQDKGMALTEEEVKNITDNATVMTVGFDALKEIEKERGYKDINPENCWNEWCNYKNNFGN